MIITPKMGNRNCHPEVLIRATARLHETIGILAGFLRRNMTLVARAEPPPHHSMRIVLGRGMSDLDASLLLRALVLAKMPLALATVLSTWCT